MKRVAVGLVAVSALLGAKFQKLGGRRQSARLEPGQLVHCINSRSGREHFAYKGEPQEIR